MDDLKLLEEFNKLSERKKESLLYALRILNRPTPELVQAEKEKIGSFPQTTEQRISKLTINELNHISDNNLHKKDSSGSGNTIVLTCKCEGITKKPLLKSWRPNILLLGIDGGADLSDFAIYPEGILQLNAEDHLNLAIPEGFDYIDVTVLATSVEWLSGGPPVIFNDAKGLATDNIPHIEGDIEMISLDAVKNYVVFRLWGDATIYAVAGAYSYTPTPYLDTASVTFHFVGSDAENDELLIYYIHQVEESHMLNIEGAYLSGIQGDMVFNVPYNSAILIADPSGRFSTASGNIELLNEDQAIIRGDGQINWRVESDEPQ